MKTGHLHFYTKPTNIHQLVQSQTYITADDRACNLTKYLHIKGCVQKVLSTIEY